MFHYALQLRRTRVTEYTPADILGTFLGQSAHLFAYLMVARDSFHKIVYGYADNTPRK